ncbi:MAG: LysM peptidoglycan-binding domain-containing protein [Chloroflexi bacterium]|nr:LysM peptidoglycan-binding domain-containing protein [Chloroflexota bacterium]
MTRTLPLAVLLAILLSVVTFHPTLASPPADNVIHTVQPGENLFRIGLKYGVSWTAIMQANGLTSTNVYVGQRLVIPVDGSTAPAPSVSYSNPGSYTIAWGDTLASIAQRFGVTTASLAAANNLAANSWVYAGQRLVIPGGAIAASANSAPAPAAVSASSYVVRGGDTLSSIAQRNGLATATLASANGLTVNSWVYTGQRLTIPGGSAQASSGVVAAPAASGASTCACGTGAGKSIVVDISEQRLYAYQDGGLLYNFVASTGERGKETRPGNYSVLVKIPNAYGATWNIWMPNWLGIYWAGSLQNGIHALPILPGGGRLWEGWLGTPVSYGCVILGAWEAQALYDWADVGTPVTIQY